MDVLRLRFDDIERHIIGFQEMTYNQARDIYYFVESRIDKVNMIVVNCNAGISRSSAVVAALMRVYNGDDREVFMSRRFWPNMYVYNMMLSAYSNK